MLPTQIDRYEIQSLLGRGGMALVYLGRDPRFNRPVAVKVLSDRSLDHPVLRKRFEREAQTIAAIEHPAIVPVYDFGEHDDRLYLVMRYMPGGSLAGLLQKGPLPLPTTAKMIARLAPALDAVHQRGIIHRDLKPGNILFDAYQNAYLSDFGIVYLAEAATALTGDLLIGTPAYMSPEQVRGEEVIGACSDLYAMGIIIYEMLSGRQPFRATTPMAIAMQHLTTPAPVLPADLVGLPPGVDALLQKALSKDPKDRFQTAAELSAELTHLAQQHAQPHVGHASGLPPTQAEDVHAGGVHYMADDSQAESLRDTDPDVRQASGLPVTQAEDVHAGGVRHMASPRRYLPWVGAGLLGLAVVCVAGGWVLLNALFPNMRINWSSAPGGAAQVTQGAADQQAAPGDQAAVAPGGAATHAAAPTPDAAAASQAGATQAAADQATAAAQPAAAAWQALFTDGFADDSSGWPEGEGYGSAYGYWNNRYRISVSRSGDLLWVSPDIEARDVRIEVDATFVDGAQDNYYGIVCRMEDENNFNYLVVTGSGKYTIGRFQDGRYHGLLPEGWARSDHLVTGEQTNHLQAECTGERLALYANGELLRTVNDDALGRGQFGLLAAAPETVGLEVHFDNFQASTP